MAHGVHRERAGWSLGNNACARLALEPRAVHKVGRRQPNAGVGLERALYHAPIGSQRSARRCRRKRTGQISHQGGNFLR